jgi:hypothetical protein
MYLVIRLGLEAGFKGSKGVWGMGYVCMYEYVRMYELTDGTVIKKTKKQF